MAALARLHVRFGQPEDLAWCVTQDDIGDEDILIHKLHRREIILAELLVRKTWNH